MKQGERPFTGRVEPLSGTPDTEFSFLAAPPGVDLAGSRIRWTFSNFVRREIVEGPEIASARHRQRFPAEGLWAVRYVVVLPDGSRRGPFHVGDVEVSKR